MSEEQLKQRALNLLNQHTLEYTLNGKRSEQPFQTLPDTLVDAASHAVQEHADMPPELSTSDDRFIAPTSADVIELGPINDTIHKINGCIRVKDLTHSVLFIKPALNDH